MALGAEADYYTSWFSQITNLESIAKSDVKTNNQTENHTDKVENM